MAPIESDITAPTESDNMAPTESDKLTPTDNEALTNAGIDVPGRPVVSLSLQPSEVLGK